MKSISAIVNARVITPYGILPSAGVRVNGTKIAEIVRDLPPDSWDHCLDAHGMILAPGFVEKHVHGGDGADFVDGNREAIETILRFYAGRGVTSVQGTTTAAPAEMLVPVLETARRWRDDEKSPGANLVGIHLEGPYLNPARCGAQPAGGIQEPSPAVTERLLEYADVITEVTIAPELPGAIDAIRAFADRGILISAGHSDARESHIRAAMDAGLSHVTHIFNTMSTVVRKGPWREAGLLECALVFDELTTEMIADFRHLPPTLIRLVLKCKMPDRLCLISDAMRGAGRPEGECFTLGGQEVVVEDGVAFTRDRGSFAGSVTPIDSMLRNLVFALDVPLQDAVRLATINPARMMGIDGHTGTIEPGKDADLVILDDDLRVRATIVGGTIIYRQ